MELTGYLTGRPLSPNAEALLPAQANVLQPSDLRQGVQSAFRLLSGARRAEEVKSNKLGGHAANALAPPKLSAARMTTKQDDATQNNRFDRWQCIVQKQDLWGLI